MEKDITDRIEMILKEYDLSPSGFSDLIQVQRSAMSHIFSRRNRPSLDLIQKVLKQFPEINSNWLLTGLGKMKQLNLFDGEEESKKSKSVNTPQSNTPDPKPIIIQEPIALETTIRKNVQDNPFTAQENVTPVPPPIINTNFQDESYKTKEVMVPKIPVDENAPRSNKNEGIRSTDFLEKAEEEKINSTSPKEKPLEKPREKEIEKIIIFYKDKTFSSYTPE